MNVQFQQHGLIWIGGSSIRRFDFSVRPMESAKFWYAPFAVGKSSPVVAFPTPANDVALWNVLSSEVQVLTTGQQEAGIKCIALSASGKRAAVSRKKASKSSQVSVEIWDTLTGRVTETVITGSAELWALAFSPVDGDLLLSTGGRGIMQVSNLRSGSTATIQDARSESKVIIAAQFSPDGKFLVVGGGTWGKINASSAACWRVDASGAATFSHTIDTQNNYSSIFSSDGKNRVYRFKKGQARTLRL